MVAKKNVRAAKSVEIFILDWQEPEPDAMFTYHQQKVSMIERMARDCFEGCKISKVQFDKDAKPKPRPADVEQYFEDAFKSKGPDDVIVIYHEGAGSGKGEDYEWKVNGIRSPINGYALLKRWRKSGLSIMLLLDGRLPSRPHWERDDDTEAGNFEVMWRGELDQTLKGKPVEGDTSDFTQNMCHDVKAFVTGIEERYKNWHAPCSIAQLMRRNKQLCENPNRAFENKPRAGKVNIIDRIVMEPDHIRATGNFTWHLKRIQAAVETADEGKGDNSESLFVEEEAADEGYAEPTLLDPVEDGAEEEVDGDTGYTRPVSPASHYGPYV